MEKYQAKSPCCGAKVDHFGLRRRQCFLCKKTWRIRKKKTGRKVKRVSTKLVESFFKHQISSVSHTATRKKISRSSMQNLMLKSRDLLIKKFSWPKIPEGNLLLIADAVVEMVEGKWRTVYMMLLRGISETDAFIVPPLILDGTETTYGWNRAFKTLDSSVTSRIKAVVSDGHKGILLEAKDYGWVVQRCQFHLLARIQGRRSRFALGKHKEEANEIYHHVCVVFKNLDQKTIQSSLNILEEIGWHSTSNEIKLTLRGFVTNYRDYRSYITHPELNLPTTNNTAESLASTVGYLKIRMRGFPTMQSFEKWVTALFKFRKSIKCNKHQPSFLG